MAGIKYLDAERLRWAILAGAQKVIGAQDRLNQLNVFPVPDGDTGSNMAATFSSISQSAQQASSRELSHLAAQLAESALYGARGNSGAILAQLFQGLSEGVAQLPSRITPPQLAEVMQHAARSAYKAIANPVEGTIITVLRDWADWLNQHAHEYEGFEDFFRDSLHAAQLALQRTTYQLEVLERSGVVDAGAQGFVHFLEGIVGLIERGDRDWLRSAASSTPFRTASIPVSSGDAFQDIDPHFPEKDHEIHPSQLDQQFCTECLIRGDHIPVDVLREALKPWGNSLVLVGNSKKVRIHIHTNDTNRVFQHISQYGELLHTKADDMWAQYRARMSWPVSSEIALITDSACCLPQEFLVKHNVLMIPLQVVINQKRYLDRINLTFEECKNALLQPNCHIHTSQPAPGDIHRIIHQAAQRSRSAYGVFISSALSGTFQSARLIAGQHSDFPVRVFDSKNIASGLGLVVQVAAEAITQHLPTEMIDKRIQYAVSHTKTFVLVQTLDYLIKGGRISRSLGWFAKLFNLLPLIGIDSHGKAEKLSVGWGRAHNRIRLQNKIKQHLKGKYQPYLLISHADALETAQSIADYLQQQLHLKNPIAIVSSTPTLMAHVGPGAVSVSVLAFEKPQEVF